MNYLFIVLITGVFVVKVSTDYMEDSWEEPNDWGRHSLQDCGPNVCPVCDAPENGGLAAFCYKKLVANLFNRKTLKENELTGHLERTIRFTLSAAQLAVIEKSTDIRDLDAAITEILKSAKVVTAAGTAKESGSLSCFWDIITDTFKIFKVLWSNSEIRFIFLIFGVLMLIWFIHKRYNKSLIAIVGVGFFLFGYLFTYLECNRKLEADPFVSYVIESGNPEIGWFRTMFNSIFRISKQDEQISKIQKESKIQLPYCRPDSVLAMYLNEMFINQIGLVIHKCMSMTMTLKDELSFPYNLIAMMSVPILFAFITKLVFKYFFNPTVWFNIFWSTNSSKTEQPAQQQSPNNSNEDRITGPNLQLLLQAFATHSLQKKDALPSGVEEVVGCLENGSPDSKSDESKNNDVDEPSINLDTISQKKTMKES